MAANNRQRYRYFFKKYLYFWIRKQEDKRLWTERQQAFPEMNLQLVSSCTQLRFANFVPKYFNCATFSKDFLAL
jgi:hypothetical protein